MAEMSGLVHRYNSVKGYGFLIGEDEQSYFFHITDVTGDPQIEKNYLVTFEPSVSPKGPRARHVVVQGKYVPIQGQPRQRATRTKAVYRDPAHFIMTRNPTVTGYVIDRVIIEDCWGEDFDPNKAKDVLREYAIAQGANAIVNLHLEKYSKSPNSIEGPLWLKVISIAVGNENYKQTMHRFHGTAVVIKKRVTV